MTALWIDQPGSAELLPQKVKDARIREQISSLMDNGLVVLRENIGADLCDQAVRDYKRFCAENAEYVLDNLDEHGREKRLVDFHHWSEAALQIAMNETALSLLDLVFEQKACPYTSLTFKFGTQQPAHKDTPHFATWPLGHFAGVWTALEDIDVEAGPLFYHPGSHKVELNRKEFIKPRAWMNFWMSTRKRNLDALDAYNHKTLELSRDFGSPVPLPLRKGDTVIWHPELIHGGMPATNPSLSRWSIVVHCATEEHQVHQHDRYFSHLSDVAPNDRYGFKTVGARKCAVAGETGFM